MGRPIGTRKPKEAVSRITHWRLKRRITQRDLSTATGIPWRTYRRLEAGQIDNPSIRHLTNLAIALDVPLEKLLEPSWRKWTAFPDGAMKPPRADTLFGSADLDQSDRGQDFSKRRPPPRPKPAVVVPTPTKWRDPHLEIEEARKEAMARRDEALRELKERRST